MFKDKIGNDNIYTAVFKWNRLTLVDYVSLIKTRIVKYGPIYIHADHPCNFAAQMTELKTIGSRIIQQANTAAGAEIENSIFRFQ